MLQGKIVKGIGGFYYVDTENGVFIVFDLTMIEGTITTGTGEIGVAHALSMSGDSTQAIINGVLDFGAIGGGIDITGANSASSPDAIINAQIKGSSNIRFNVDIVSISSCVNKYTSKQDSAFEFFSLIKSINFCFYIN